MHPPWVHDCGLFRSSYCKSPPASALQAGAEGILLNVCSIRPTQIHKPTWNLVITTLAALNIFLEKLNTSHIRGTNFHLHKKKFHFILVNQLFFLQLCNCLCVSRFGTKLDSWDDIIVYLSEVVEPLCRDSTPFIKSNSLGSHGRSLCEAFVRKPAFLRESSWAD